ncbi:MAG: EVE domain-containing protein, partial [Candidatus Puniceispirillum sp.]|nr:EVE domain-containing protein [Candidatus Puniceispirillum sp.]
ERLQDMALVRQARLSVMPVTESQWHIIMDMAETTL